MDPKELLAQSIEDELRRTIGSNLSAALPVGASWQKVADQAGVRANTVLDAVNMKRVPDLNTLSKVALALKVNASRFLERPLADRHLVQWWTRLDEARTLAASDAQEWLTECRRQPFNGKHRFEASFAARVFLAPHDVDWIKPILEPARTVATTENDLKAAAFSVSRERDAKGELFRWKLRRPIGLPDLGWAVRVRRENREVPGLWTRLVYDMVPGTGLGGVVDNRGLWSFVASPTPYPAVDAAFAVQLVVDATRLGDAKLDRITNYYGLVAEFLFYAVLRSAVGDRWFDSDNEALYRRALDTLAKLLRGE